MNPNFSDGLLDYQNGFMSALGSTSTVWARAAMSGLHPIASKIATVKF